MTALKETVRERYLNFMDDWHAGERHLAYTLIAVTAILAIGAIIVPTTLSKGDPLPTSERQLLAERYVQAMSKVREPKDVPSVQETMKAFGTDGGSQCSEAITKLHDSYIVRRPGRPSFLDRSKVQQLRITMRVYCPARDARYGKWLRNKGLATKVR